MEGLCGGTWCAVIRAQRDLPAYPSFHLGTLFPFLSHQLWVVCLTFHQHWQQSVKGKSRIHINSCNWWLTTKSSERYLLCLKQWYQKSLTCSALDLLKFPDDVSSATASSICFWSGLNRLDNTDDELYGMVQGRTGY